MISKAQLESIGYTSYDETLYTKLFVWDYEFNIKTQELLAINDGIGEPVFLCKVTDFDKLQDLIDLGDKP